MTALNSRERFKRMFEHREADRVPMLGSPWSTTIERWRSEGMPEDADFSTYFGFDRIAGMGVDVSLTEHEARRAGSTTGISLPPYLTFTCTERARGFFFCSPCLKSRTSLT